MKNQAIGEFIGKYVKIWQGGSESYYYTEEGTLESYDHPWISLIIADGERVCIPVYGVRMIRQARPAAEMTDEQGFLEAA